MMGKNIRKKRKWKTNYNVTGGLSLFFPNLRQACSFFERDKR